MLSWPFLAYCCVVSFPPTHQIALLSLCAVLRIFISCLFCRCVILLSAFSPIFSHTYFHFTLCFSPFSTGVTEFLYIVGFFSFNFSYKTHLSFASGPQVFSPYILIFLFHYFVFLLFSLNNLCNRKARGMWTTIQRTTRMNGSGCSERGGSNNGDCHSELYNVYFKK